VLNTINETFSYGRILKINMSLCLPLGIIEYMHGLQFGLCMDTSGKARRK